MADAMRPTLVVFVRAPRFGTVKRRLAAGIGPLAALAFHRGSLDRLLRSCGRDRRWTTILSVTPDDAARGSAPWARGLPRRPQGRGDLGVRMARALSGPRPTIIVGADIPAIRPAHISLAFRALGGADLVFGPATDGGFWLVGSSGRRPLPTALFAGVRWSTGQALADALATVPAQWKVALGTTLADVDDAAAWHRWRDASSTLSRRGPPTAADRA